MEPTTLYLLYKFQNGPEQAKELPFNSVAYCQEFFNTRVKSKKIEVIRYACQVYTAGSKPPDWYRNHFDQKIIHGVPLDSRYAPLNRP